MARGGRLAISPWLGPCQIPPARRLLTVPLIKPSHPPPPASEHPPWLDHHHTMPCLPADRTPSPVSSATTADHPEPSHARPPSPPAPPPAAPFRPHLSLKDEDRALLYWVSHLGTGKWVDIAKRVGSRSGKQCRERWTNQLDPLIDHSPFTHNEDMLIIAMQQSLQANRWCEVSKHLPGRPENAIKNRWNSRELQRKRHELLAARAQPPAVGLFPGRPGGWPGSPARRARSSTHRRLPYEPAGGPKAAHGLWPTQSSTLADPLFPPLHEHHPTTAGGGSWPGRFLPPAAGGSPPASGLQESPPPRFGPPFYTPPQAPQAVFATPVADDAALGGASGPGTPGFPLWPDDEWRPAGLLPKPAPPAHPRLHSPPALDQPWTAPAQLHALFPLHSHFQGLSRPAAAAEDVLLAGLLPLWRPGGGPLGDALPGAGGIFRQADLLEARDDQLDRLQHDRLQQELPEQLQEQLQQDLRQQLRHGLRELRHGRLDQQDQLQHQHHHPHPHEQHPRQQHPHEQHPHEQHPHEQQCQQ
ncbi:hypothetical protein PtA15_15A101 [Puccinia triticina]|uniref:Uncharacterized protein n=1 Tax=Puccinia triticina TaxID=208348 RepID=A0ABY7D496_9BASI|nr:uncharacterized protein PtA15_15A101 [Puccinia triticina]WAQ91710.1 hypothetical protein PtA15_15A101 [Puccinia triticina]